MMSGLDFSLKRYQRDFDLAGTLHPTPEWVAIGQAVRDAYYTYQNLTTYTLDPALQTFLDAAKPSDMAQWAAAARDTTRPYIHHYALQLATLVLDRKPDLGTAAILADMVHVAIHDPNETVRKAGNRLVAGICLAHEDLAYDAYKQADDIKNDPKTEKSLQTQARECCGYIISSLAYAAKRPGSKAGAVFQRLATLRCRCH